MMPVSLNKKAIVCFRRYGSQPYPTGRTQLLTLPGALREGPPATSNGGGCQPVCRSDLRLALHRGNSSMTNEGTVRYMRQGHRLVG